MLFKKRTKKDIPHELRLELREAQEKKRNAGPVIKYSLSLDDNTINNAVQEIKETPLKPSFRETLFNYIDKSGFTDPQIYKKAKINKRVFSKIRTGEKKYVSKNTAICFGLALELSIEDLSILLNSNNDTLYENEYFDIAIRWCIKNKIYDIEQVNDILYACDLNLLTK